MKNPIPELDIFKPVPASLKDENDWPIFPINNAEIAFEKTGELANLLLNDEGNPMRVTGRIEQLDREEKCHLIDRDSVPANILISAIQRFSFGQYDDGTATFWVRGRAGWFEISPSRRYKAVFNEMAEAIKILYFIADTFHEMPTRKQVRKTSPETLFEQYAEDAVYKCADVGEARRRYIRHAHALCALMRQGKEGISWKPTEIFKFLNSAPAEESPELEETPEDDATLQTPQRLTNEANSSDEETAAHLARKGKSALRPKIGKGKGRASSKRPSADRIELQEEDEDIEMDDIPDSATPLRRKSEDQIDNRSPKRRRGRPPKDKPIEADLPQQPPTSTVPEDEPQEATLPLQDRKPSQKAPQKLPTARVTIKTSPLPSFEPNAPGDVWSCSFDGCSHRIFGASTQASKGLIEEHYKMHAHDSQKQLDVVYAEERPYLPVGNLINRIREMAAKGGGGAAVEKEKQVPPWKRELMELSKGVERKY